MEGLLQTLAKEVADFGIKVTLIEPGPFATDFMGESSLRKAGPIAAYDRERQRLSEELSTDMFEDPARTVAPLLRAIDAREPPLHLMLGRLLPLVKDVYAERIRCWEAWGA